jgi:hypothetical protein
MNQENIQINMQMPMDVDAWMLNGGGHGWATPSPGKLQVTLSSETTLKLEGATPCFRVAINDKY